MSDSGERAGLLLPILIPVGGLAVIVVVLFTLSRVLLSLKPNAATAVALVAAAGILAVATVRPAPQPPRRARRGSSPAASAGAALRSAGSSAPSPASRCSPAGSRSR